MKTRRWFFVLSALLLAALLCMIGPAAMADGPDSETAFRADLARLGAYTDELAAMREDALISYLNCLFDAETTDDPIEQERLLDKAELCWTLYADLLSVQNKAEFAAFAQTQTDPYLDAPEPTAEAGEEFLLDDSFPNEADFLPDDAGSRPDRDEFDWGFAGCPFYGAHGPWQPEWTPGWGNWDDEYHFYNPWSYYEDGPWDYYYDNPFDVYAEETLPPTEEPAPAEQPNDAAEPVEASDPAEASEPVDAAEPAELVEPAEPAEPAEINADALPAETPDETDGYEDWAEFEELFMQALLEALFGDEAQNMLAMTNPWIDAADPDEAAAVAGLRLDAPADLPKEMALQNYRAMEGTVQADYSDGYDELTLRASLDQKGLALTGDYNDYSVQWQEKVGDLVIDCLGDGEKINAAAWTVDGVSYALDMAPGKEGLGLSYDEVSAITAAVKAVPVQTGEKTEPSDGPALPSDEPLEMPFELAETENLMSAAETVPAGAEPAEAQPTPARPTRLIIGGGETYIYFD